MNIKMNVICRQWRHSRVGRLLGGSAMTATFHLDVQLTACYTNNLTGTDVDVTTFILHM